MFTFLLSDDPLLIERPPGKSIHWKHSYHEQYCQTEALLKLELVLTGKSESMRGISKVYNQNASFSLFLIPPSKAMPPESPQDPWTSTTPLNINVMDITAYDCQLAFCFCSLFICVYKDLFDVSCRKICKCTNCIRKMYMLKKDIFLKVVT